MDNDTDVFAKEYLLPVLKRIDDALNQAGIGHTVMPGDEGIPGIWINYEENRVFCALFAFGPVEEEEEEEEKPVMILRLSAPAAEETETAEGAYVRWAFPVEELSTVEELMHFVKLFWEEKPLRVWPDASAAAENIPDDGTENGELSSGEADKDAGDGASGEGISGYAPGQYGALVRLNAISSLLTGEEEEHTGVIYGAVPYLQLKYEDFYLTFGYEAGDDEETFLLHIRTDVPVLEGRAQELCRIHNRENSFTGAYCDTESFPVFATGVTEGEHITFHACMPETGGMPEEDTLISAIRLFAAEVEKIR